MAPPRDARPAKPAVILNPNAGSGRALDAWDEIEPKLRGAYSDISLYETQKHGDAPDLARAALIAQHDLIISIGGDGTHNEVVNGFFGDDGTPLNPNAQLATIPCGTGSDLARLLGISELEAAVDTIENGVALPIDIARMELTGRDGESTVKFFMNITDFGLGGAAVERVNFGGRRYRGKLGYLLAILVSILTYKTPRMKLTIDGEDFDELFSSVIMANGQYFGGGIHVAPNARLTNGALETLAIREMPVFDSLRYLPKLYDGTFVELEQYVVYRSAKEIHASSDAQVSIDMDGESPGTLPIDVSVLPRALPLRVPRGYSEAAPDSSIASPDDAS